LANSIQMFSRSTLLHLRFPFSFFLLPVFLFAWSQSTSYSWYNAILSFIILHLLVYPASNGYNSYFDRDQSSIGGLRVPPPVSQELYWVSLALDGVAVLLGLLISWQFSLMVLVYGLVSKAYSHPSIRIKQYPWSSWLIAGFFQGFFTFIMSLSGIVENFSLHQVLQPKILIAAFLSSLILWGSYPMTQIYQHEEDKQRGDITLSYKLGILGTFHFTAAVFSLSVLAYLWYFYHFHTWYQGLIFISSMLPVTTYFAFWYFKVRKNKAEADFDHTMRLNQVSAICLNTCFAILLLLNH